MSVIWKYMYVQMAQLAGTTREVLHVNVGQDFQVLLAIKVYVGLF